MVAIVQELATFATVEQAVAEIAAGRMVVVVDDTDRENEGDLVMAADCVTAADVNFMATHARGWICLALTEGRCDELGLELMAPGEGDRFRTAFTVTVDARSGVTTGISAADRAHTVQVAAVSGEAADLVKGGHISPLRARNGGVLARRGHTEASVDLASLAGRRPSGLICEVLNADGTMARRGDLARFCRRHGLLMLRIADLVEYRRQRAVVERVVTTRLPTRFGEFRAVGYRSADEREHVALVRGDLAGDGLPVRVHRQCFGDVLRSDRCACSSRLSRALEDVTRAGRGVVVYLVHSGHVVGVDCGGELAQIDRRLADAILADLGVGRRSLQACV